MLAPNEAPFTELVARLRRSFESGVTRPLAFRKQQLDRLATCLRDNQRELLAALKSDLGKPELEGYSSETQFLAAELEYVSRNFEKWARPEKAGVPLVLQPGSAQIMPQPLGVALIIAPWNYPLNLALAPLIAAIAAGNCAVVKPSEVAPACADAMAKLLPRYLDPSCFAVVQGGVPETTALLAQRWDFIFYTGNGAVGRVVMEAASKNLTPVVLELGGKSPCIVDIDVDLDVAARRIAWGKFFNAGQTCIAPDYVLAHRDIEHGLLQRIKDNVREFFGAEPRASPDYARVVNERHVARLQKLLDSGEVVVGGEVDAATKYIAPTVLRNVGADSPVMAEEIFGPILPVLTVADVDEAIRFVNARPRPLALYVFSRDDARVERVLERTTSGGACVNDTLTHLVPPELPFGGVGPSGMGAYHGRFGFDAFSHRKAVLTRSTKIDPKLRYPPYTEDKMKWVKRLL